MSDISIIDQIEERHSNNGTLPGDGNLLSEGFPPGENDARGPDLALEFVDATEMRFLKEALDQRRLAEQLMAFVVGTISRAHALAPDDSLDETGRIRRGQA